MSFIDDSIENVKNSILKEVTVGVGAPGFVGKAGMGIDRLFGGGFHPENNEPI